MNQIVSICYKPDHLENKPKDHYTRIALQEARLVEGHGIEGDSKGGHPERQLNIMSQEVLERLAQQGFTTTNGQMGEQIVVSGIDLTLLEEGAQLQFGETVLIEVVKHRNGCARFEHIQSHPTPTLEQKGTLGVMAKVITGGIIHVGDSVTVLTSEVTA
jgi:MOSC domain-containing protein YiiM